MIYILGGMGFVGSGFTRYCQSAGIAHRVITRTNYDEFRDTVCDVLIDASGNSRKYLADREPLTDFDRSVRQVAVSLEAFTAGTYVLVSSGDVYEDASSPHSTRESRRIDISAVSRYGQHKLLAEQLVIGRHPAWLIIRAGGFVGPGLQKNAIFDILSGGKVWLSPDSRLQFLHTDRAARLVMSLVTAGVQREIVNIGGSGLMRLGDLHAESQSTALFDPAAPTVTYELSLAKLAALVPSALPKSGEMVRRFAADWRRAATINKTN